jgi:hypothetical protein
MIWWYGGGALLLGLLALAWQQARINNPNYWARWSYCRFCRAQAKHPCLRRSLGGGYNPGRRHAWRPRMDGRA